jgi:hypothetical protein
MVLTLQGRLKFMKKTSLSGQQISEQQIPGWNDLLLSLVEMTGRMPYLKYVEWDIIFSGNKSIWFWREIMSRNGWHTDAQTLYR